MKYVVEGQDRQESGEQPTWMASKRQEGNLIDLKRIDPGQWIATVVRHASGYVINITPHGNVEFKPTDHRTMNLWGAKHLFTDLSMYMNETTTLTSWTSEEQRIQTNAAAKGIIRWFYLNFKKAEIKPDDVFKICQQIRCNIDAKFHQAVDGKMNKILNVYRNEQTLNQNVHQQTSRRPIFGRKNTEEQEWQTSRA